MYRSYAEPDMSFHTEQIVKVIVKLNYKLCLVEFAVGSIPTHSAYIYCNPGLDWPMCNCANGTCAPLGLHNCALFRFIFKDLILHLHRLRFMF